MVSRSLVTVAVLSLLAVGCDRQPPENAQGERADAALKQNLSGTIDRSRAGSLLPAVALTDTDGREINLGALQGQPILVNLWATWCAPCVVEMPLLDRLADDLDGTLRVVTISQDLQGADAVRPFFAARDLQHLQPWLDPNGEVAAKLDAAELPTTVLYDASGREVWRVAGDYDWSSEKARNAIAAATGG